MRPSAPRRVDEAIVADVRQALLSEALLGRCFIRPSGKGDTTRAAVLFPEGSAGQIEVSVHRGVVKLEGEVADVHEKHLAGTLARRVPGCCDVINALEVPSPSRPGCSRSRTG
jgi:hypothetical protein